MFMNLTKKILDYALNCFNVAGAYPISTAESYLILGLESTPQRNLDEFEKINNRLVMKGITEYIQPRLEIIINRLKESGILAEPIGKYGYASHYASLGTINLISLKHFAIKVGLGKRGKNTVVLNSTFGSRLRFAALKVDVLFETTKDNLDEESPFCRDCSICIDECPVNILEPYRMIDDTKCLSNITNNATVIKDKKLIMCDICLKKCPVNQTGFTG
jgi:epoxyqueuosine reductase QueG